MKVKKHRKAQLGNWLSIYGLLFFLCLPIWKAMTIPTQYSEDDLTELEEELREEAKDSADEEDHLNKQTSPSNSQQAIYINAALLAKATNLFKPIDVALDVMTPPPKPV